MSVPRSPHRQGRRLALAAIFCIFFCGVVVTLEADFPMTALDVPRPPAAGQVVLKPLTLEDPTAGPAQPAARRTLVREVDRQDWHQLDGDQLLPAHQGDNPDVLGARRAARLRAAATQQQQQQQEQPLGILAEPRRPWPGDALRKVAVNPRSLPPPPPPPLEGQRDLAPFPIVRDVAALPARHKEEADESKIALRSLRLVVHLTEDKAADDEEEEEGRAVPLTHRLQVCPQRTGRGGPAVLLSQPRGKLQAHTPRLSARATADAAQKEASTRKTTAAVHTVVRRREEADRRAAATPVYSDEELRRRCIIANGRAAQPAVLRAMLEGRLRSDCLIVAADVGNDIPTTENNAKGAVTIVSLFVSTLFLVFAFIF